METLWGKFDEIDQMYVSLQSEIESYFKTAIEKTKDKEVLFSEETAEISGVLYPDVIYYGDDGPEYYCPKKLHLDNDGELVLVCIDKDKTRYDYSFDMSELSLTELRHLARYINTIYVK